MITQEQISEQLKAVIEGVLAAGSDVTQMVNYLAEEGRTLTPEQRQTYTDYIAQLEASPNTPMPEGFTLRTQDDNYTTPTAKILRSLVNSVCLAKIPTNIADPQHLQELAALNHQLQIYLARLIASFKDQHISIPLDKTSPVYQALATAIAQNGAEDNLASHTKVIHDRFLYADYVHQSLVTYQAHLEKMQTPPYEKIGQVETLAARFADTDRTSIIPTADENTLIVEAVKHELKTRIDVTLQDKEAQAKRFIQEIIDHRFEGVFDDRNSGIDHVLTRYSDPDDRLKAQLYGFRPKLAQLLGEITEIRELRTSAANTTDIDTIKAQQHRLDILPYKHQMITSLHRQEQKLRFSAGEIINTANIPRTEGDYTDPVDVALGIHRLPADTSEGQNDAPDDSKLGITISKLDAVISIKKKVEKATTAQALINIETDLKDNESTFLKHRDKKSQFLEGMFSIIDSLKKRFMGLFSNNQGPTAATALVSTGITSSKYGLFATSSAKEAQKIQEVITTVRRGSGSGPGPAAAA